MSEMAIFRQQPSSDTANSMAFVDLPSHHAYHCPTP
jgi:hypothetical protein